MRLLKNISSVLLFLSCGHVCGLHAEYATYYSSNAPVVVQSNEVACILDGASFSAPVANDGVLAFLQSSALSVSVPISGVGSLYQGGSGTTVLSGSAAYAGGTFVNDGLLVFANDYYLGSDSTGNLDISAGGVGSAFSSVMSYSSVATSFASVANGYWVSQSSLHIGFQGAAWVSLSPGGVIAATYGALGSQASNAFGAVAMSGGLMSFSENLNIGQYGRGDLSMSGGSLSASNMVIGFVGGSVGNLSISSGAAASQTSVYLGLAGTGSLTLSGSSTLSSLGGLEMAYYSGSTGILNLGDGTNAGKLELSSGIHGGGGNAVINLNQSSHYDLSAPISGSVSMNLQGTGTTVLSGSNSYTGPTSVQAGKLVVNGSLGSSSLTVSSGAVLGGSGLIAGNTVIAGTHSPGNSPGVQTFGGDLSYQPGASMIWQLSANTTSNAPVVYDQVMVGGNLSFSGPTGLQLVFNDVGSLVNWTDALWRSNQSWTIYQVSGVTTGLVNLTLADYYGLLDATGNGFASSLAGASFSIRQSGQNVVLDYNAAAVPEPSTYALVAFGVMALALLLRQNKRVA